MPQRVGVVFVHGFLSSAATWAAFLRLLGEDDKLAALSPHAFQYATPRISLNPLRRIPSLDDVADSLGTYLAHDLAHHSRLVLVSHSQGGLVVQRLLARTLADGRGQELARIRRIVLFACPNSGSDLALLLRRRAIFWRHPQERELRPLNQTISETHRIVINQVIHATSVSASTCPIRIVAFAGESDAVVTPASAKSVFPEVGVLPGDHFSIIQADSPDHRSYTTLRWHLREATADPVPSAPVPTQARSPRPPPTRSGGAAAGWHGELVDKLLAVPRMAEPAFREQLYDLLPTVIMHQLPRDSTARLQLFALVRGFDHYRHLEPWPLLAAALEALVPEHPAVAEVVATLTEAGLLPRSAGPDTSDSGSRANGGR